VPSRAVTVSKGQSTVQLLQADGTTTTQSVTVIANEGLDAIIQGDIPAGSKIVTVATVNSRQSVGPFGGE
jgi:hypothetical protein